MSINSHETSQEFSHSVPETNKKLQEVIGKVMKLLEHNEELKQEFNKQFKSVFESVTNNSEKLDVLLDSINNKMMSELSSLQEKFQNDPDLHSEVAKSEAKNIIKKYTHMGQFALASSVQKNA